MYSTPEKLFSKFRPKRVVKKIQNKKIRKIFERQSEIRKKEHRQRSLILNHREIRVRKRIEHILQHRQQTHPNRQIRQIPVRLRQIPFLRNTPIYLHILVRIITPRSARHRERADRYLRQILPHHIHRVHIDYYLY